MYSVSTEDDRGTVETCLVSNLNCLSFFLKLILICLLLSRPSLKRFDGLQCEYYHAFKCSLTKLTTKSGDLATLRPVVLGDAHAPQRRHVHVCAELLCGVFVRVP